MSPAPIFDALIPHLTLAALVLLLLAHEVRLVQFGGIILFVMGVLRLIWYLWDWWQSTRSEAE